uniref:Uncharacterized protein n=1 Tax=Wuchereria bancrofti TaxID=6293 RepID=A0AAF5PKU0_WUCBA
MSYFCKTNNHKLRNTLCLPIQRHLDKDLKSNEEYGCTVQQQQESSHKNRTFIISDSQHCSVSATLSLGRPKKLFISKNLNNSKEISTSHSRIDQKSPLANFETKTTSPSSSQHFPGSVNSNNDSIFCCNKTAPKLAETTSVTVTPKITIDIPHPDSPQSTLNSCGSGGYRGDCSSVNSLHSTEYKDGINRRQNNINEFRESLSSRLSRGFLEFAQGSRDRLQKCKNKLQDGRWHKDSSKPPPANRKKNFTVYNAKFIHNAKFSPMRSAFALKEDRANLILPTRSTSDFFLTSKSTASAVTFIPLSGFNRYIHFFFRNFASTTYLLLYNYQNSDDLKRSSQHLKDTTSNSSAPSSGYGSTRPRAIYQPSTSFQMTSAMVAQRRSNKIENYSVVHSTPYCHNSLSEKLSAASAIPNSNNTISHDKMQQQQQHAAVSKSPSSHQVYGSNASSGSRHSSGIHVTPLPSDSGIVDYELSNYKQKLLYIRQQIQRCNEEREQFRGTSGIQNLTSDKQGLQRKCLQIEREFFQLRECFDELIRNRDETLCGSCRKRIICYITTANTNNSIVDKRVRPPLPTPRYSKESLSERELRNEVDELRGEVSTLRDTLNEQIGLFADWEKERIKILKSNNLPSDRLGLLSTNDASSVEMTSQLSRDLKILIDGKSYIVSHNRLI